MAGAIKALKKYGPGEPQLYPAALAYFTSSRRALEEAGDELEAVLKKIDENGLMAPLQVVQTLSATPVATLGLVKKYLSDTIEKERKEIANVSLASLLRGCVCKCVYRIVALSRATAVRRKRRRRRSKSLVASLRSSKRLAVQHAEQPWIFPRFISFASTLITNDA